MKTTRYSKRYCRNDWLEHWYRLSFEWNFVWFYREKKLVDMFYSTCFFKLKNDYDFISKKLKNIHKLNFLTLYTILIKTVPFWAKFLSIFLWSQNTERNINVKRVKKNIIYLIQVNKVCETKLQKLSFEHSEIRRPAIKIETHKNQHNAQKWVLNSLKKTRNNLIYGFINRNRSVIWDEKWEKQERTMKNLEPTSQVHLSIPVCILDASIYIYMDLSNPNIVHNKMVKWAPPKP